MIPKDLQDWLDERCPDEHISEKDGILYLPNDVCERKLDFMQRKFDVIWSTRNYKSTLYYFNNEIWISASQELAISGFNIVAGGRLDGSDIWIKSKEKFEKVLVGCATFRALSIAPNTHLDATAKSFCTVNASMDLGDQFGRFLSTQTMQFLPVKGKRKADMVIVAKYEKAIKDNDQQAIDDILSLYEIQA